MIRFDGVTKTFPDGAVAVDDLSLTAPTGRITVLVGPSGCGKTTSLQLVNRMVEPSRGAVAIDGVDTGRLAPAQLRRGIGYVPQHLGLFPHRTVLQNIGTVPQLLGWDRARRRQRSRELLERVGLDPRLAHRYPRELCEVEQRRVVLARALAADPPVLLVDEPFSGLDPLVRAGLQAELRRLQSELGTTVVLATADIGEAITLGHHVAVLRPGGSLAQAAEPSTLLASPADAYVADVVGRDRGYQALEFRSAPRLPLRAERTALLGERLEGCCGSWVLVVDEGNRPLGWVEPERVGGRQIGDADLLRGGVVAKAGGSLREALDAALSSPSHRGVVVEDGGELVGTVLAHEVLTLIGDADGTEPHEAAPARAGAQVLGLDR